MRTLKRNKRPFYFAPFVERKPLTYTDEFGNTLETGEHRVVYGNPVLLRANISAARGETETRQFGEDLSYDRVITMDEPAILINEYSILWIDTLPELDDSGAATAAHDYVVRKVARSLNSVSIAVSRVSVSM